MEITQYPRIIRTCRFCAKYTFIIGSMIMLLFCLTHAQAVNIAGMIFMLSATLINMLMLFILLINLLIHPTYYLDLLKTAATILFNVPVAGFYLWLAEQIRQLPF